MTASTANLRALVDTNVLVYASDLDDPSKHTIARELLEQLSNQGCLIFSAQVFHEFDSVMMRPSRMRPLSPVEVAVIFRELEATGEVVPVTTALTFRALDVLPRHGLSFWDALIWPAAATRRSSSRFGSR
jgi:predicted nucleic acid-binding protein